MDENKCVVESSKFEKKLVTKWLTLDAEREREAAVQRSENKYKEEFPVRRFKLSVNDKDPLGAVLYLPAKGIYEAYIVKPSQTGIVDTEMNRVPIDAWFDVGFVVYNKSICAAREALSGMGGFFTFFKEWHLVRTEELDVLYTQLDKELEIDRP